MNKLIILALLLALSACKNGNKAALAEKNSVEPSIKKIKNDTLDKAVVTKDAREMDTTLRKFIPKGYTILKLASGDANLDGIADKILVLATKDEESETNDALLPRPLLILLGHANGTHKLAQQNDNAVYAFMPNSLYEDPFKGVTIKNGYFSIEYNVAGGRHWEQIVTFKYNNEKKNWLLYKDHYTSYKLNDSDDPDAEALVLEMDKLETMKNFGTITFAQFNANK